MHQPTELNYWDFPNTIAVPDGYCMTEIPDMTRGNFVKLVDEHNNLVEVVNALLSNRPDIIDNFEKETY